MAGPVCFVVGARPNFMKVAPVLRALQERGTPTYLVHTGQHYDAEMSDVFLAELGLPAPDVSLGVGSGNHGEQTARALIGIEQVLLEHEPVLVVVPGDVNSTLAGALAAVKLQIPVAHLEAGLRSFDPTMPEEHNRRLTDHVSSLLLVHSESAIRNLEREGLDVARVRFVGNTMIDSLYAHVAQARSGEPWARLGVDRRRFALVTLHRPALVDDDELLAATMTQLADLAEEMPVVFPVHPRTREQLLRIGHIAPLELLLTEPLDYLDFIGLEAEAAFVLTDSGGVQEETSALGVRCFTLRDSTERPVTVELGTNTLLGGRPERIAEIPLLLDRPLPDQPIPLWDGRAGERAADELAHLLAGLPVGRTA